MLQRLVEWEESDREGGVARYFEAAMCMFEQVPAPQYVIKIAESALLMLEQGHPKSVSILCVSFTRTWISHMCVHACHMCIHAFYDIHLAYCHFPPDHLLV